MAPSEVEPADAADLTEFDPQVERFLCVVAHPDDIEYGLSAAVAKWTEAGATGTYFLLTSGEAGIDTLPPAQAGPLREEEERASAAVVGVEEVVFAGHPDGAVVYGLDLRRDIAREIRRRRPQVVLTITHAERFAGGFPNQADHRAVGLATLDAVADAGNRWIFPELLEAGLEPWSGVRYVAYSATPEPTHYVDVSQTFEPAVASLEAHRQYLEALGDKYPAPRELLTSFMATPELAAYGEKVWTSQLLTRG